jgi:hypothetical protein
MKLIKLFAVAMLLVLSANAQNPPLPDPARGITIINGHIGLNTNSATAGQSIVFNGSAVVWGAGAGTSFDTNANWIVNGTWKFTNSVKFPGHIYDDTDKESISSQQRILFDVNEIEAVEWWARFLERANSSIALDWANSIMNDNQNVLSENFNSRFLAGSDGNSVYNWESGNTYDGQQNRIMNLKQGNTWDSGDVPVLDSPNRRLYASDGNIAYSFGGYTLNDANATPSINHNTRTLRDDNNLNVLDWLNHAIGTQGPAWTINGLSSTTLLTNIVTSGAPYLTISTLDGHLYTITGVGTVITNNASPTFGTTVVNGKILSTATTAITTPLAQVHTVNTNQLSTEVSFLAENYGVTNIPSFVGRRARGTAASPTAVQTDDVLSAFTGRGYGTTAFSALSKGSVTVRAGQNWTDANQGTYIQFMTTSNSTTSIREVARIDDVGRLGIGTTTPASPLDVVGAANVSGTVTSGGLTVNGNSTLGQNSGSTISLVGSTVNIANGVNFGAGQLIIPSSGTVSNNSSFTSSGTIQGSTLIAGGSSTWSGGTNNTVTISVNNSTGTLFLDGQMTMTTNTISAALPVINTVYTNNTHMLHVSAGVVFPTAISSVSASALWVMSGSQTQYFGTYTTCAGVSGAVTNTVSGWVQPNALYMVTNIATGAGTPALVQGLFNETRL